MNINSERMKDGWQVSAWEGKDRLASGGAPTIRESATWLIKTMRRRLAKAEALVVEMGLLTEADLDQLDVEEENAT